MSTLQGLKGFRHVVTISVHRDGWSRSVGRIPARIIRMYAFGTNGHVEGTWGFGAGTTRGDNWLWEFDLRVVVATRELEIAE